MISDTALFMFGIQGKILTSEETAWLNHPLTAGVILFTRNYDNPAQIRALVQALRETANHDVLIAVDHEGGRVQRFKEGFTRIPPMAKLGELYDQNPDQALALAHDMAYVLAYEIADCDIDFSFAPVLDVQTDYSQIIGNRGFHHDVQTVGKIAEAFYAGLRDAGIIGVGKHFPGHGHVVADSHVELPICDADFTTLTARDLPPFVHLIQSGIEAIMPAHIRYKCVDDLPAGFSDFWLQTVLREQLAFGGCIISDDLDMAGAAAYGDMPARIALAARHCDLILLCNNAEDMRAAFAHTQAQPNHQRQARLETLRRDKARHHPRHYLQALANVSEKVALL